MRAGSLRERVTFQRAINSEDGFGNVVSGWADLIERSANIRETPGKEAVAAGRIEAEKTATIRVRSCPATRGVTAADRIIARGQAWNIRSVVAVGDGRELIEFLCEAGVAI